MNEGRISVPSLKNEVTKAKVRSFCCQPTNQWCSAHFLTQENKGQENLKIYPYDESTLKFSFTGNIFMLSNKMKLKAFFPCELFFFLTYQISLDPQRLCFVIIKYQKRLT